MANSTGDKVFIYESDVPNDRIDIYAPPKLQTKVEKPLNDAEFRIRLKGNAIDYSIVNALRRTILMKIPIYGFNRSNIHIDVKKTRTMYNNDMLFNQFETLPIFDIDNEFDLEHPDIFFTGELKKHLFGFYGPNVESTASSSERKSKKRPKKIEISLNKRNTTDTDIFISTHHLILKVDGVEVDNYHNRPYVNIIVLRPNEEISMHAEANLGISTIDAAYEATTNAIHVQVSDTEYVLIYETLGQLDKAVIFAKACRILIKKLENLQAFLREEYPEDRPISETIEIKLVGEEHTLGVLLATVLQKSEYTSKAAYSKPSPFVDEIVLSYIINPKSKVKPIKVLVDCIDYLIQVFNLILEQNTK